MVSTRTSRLTFPLAVAAVPVPSCTSHSFSQPLHPFPFVSTSGRSLKSVETRATSPPASSRVREQAAELQQLSFMVKPQSRSRYHRQVTIVKRPSQDLGYSTSIELSPRSRISIVIIDGRRHLHPSPASYSYLSRRIIAVQFLELGSCRLASLPVKTEDGQDFCRGRCNDVGCAWSRNSAIAVLLSPHVVELSSAGSSVSRGVAEFVRRSVP